jgi:hypothetical protein
MNVVHFEIIARGYARGVENNLPPPPPLQRAQRYFYCPITEAHRTFESLRLPRVRAALLGWVKGAAGRPLHKLKEEILELRPLFHLMGPEDGVDVAIVYTLRAFMERGDVAQAARDQLGLALRMLILDESGHRLLTDHAEQKITLYKEFLTDYSDGPYKQNALQRIKEGPVMPADPYTHRQPVFPALFMEDLQLAYAAQTIRMHMEDEHYRGRRQLIYHARTLYRRYYALMGVLRGEPVTRWWVDAMLMHELADDAHVEALCRLAGVALPPLTA